MAGGKNKNYVSFWFWFWAQLVMVLPCIGFVMMLVWAFVGDNESRKNFFRAMLAWGVIGMVIWFGLAAAGFWPLIREKWVQPYLHAK